MKTPKTVSEGKNHKAIDLGTFDNLSEYSYQHQKLQKEIKGKVFTGAYLAATGAEVSFQYVAPFTGLSFIHKHNHHEEIYVFLKGKGQFQVDESVFDISEGTVIRVAPAGNRIYRNNSADPIVFMCIQCMAGSLDSFTVDDGALGEGKIAWME